MNKVLEPDPPGRDHGRELEPHPGDRDRVVVERAGDGGEPAPELKAERVDIGRGAADDGIEHDVQEALEVLELVGGDLRRDVRIDGLRRYELHGERSRGLEPGAHVEGGDPEEEPVAERVPVPQCRLAQPRPSRSRGASSRATLRAARGGRARPAACGSPARWPDGRAPRTPR